MKKDDVKQFAGFDFKAIGYLTSMVSVVFLGAVAWPGPQDPKWILPILLAGMATSILGMGFRYLAHIEQKKQMAQKQNRR